MLMRFLVSTLLLTGSIAFAQSALEIRASQMQHAKELTREQQFAKAEQIYEQLLKAYPNDLDLHLAHAGVLAWQKKYADSERAYREIIRRNPSYSDAKLGLARVLYWQGNIAEAKVLVNQVLLANPKNADAKELSQKLAQAEDDLDVWYLRIGGKYDYYSFTQDAFGSEINFSYTRARIFSARAGFRYFNRFGENMYQPQLGGTVLLNPDAILSFDLNWAPGAKALPTQSYGGEVTVRYFEQLFLSLGYRFSDYAEAYAHMIMPQVAWRFIPQLQITARNFITVTMISNNRYATTYSLLARLDYDPLDNLSAYVAYAYANEAFDPGNVITPLRGFTAHHAIAGVRWLFTRNFGVQANIDEEFRNNGMYILANELSLFATW